MTSSGIDPGLCGRCLHCRLVETGRSVFYLCTRSFTDPSYRKYPPLPVLRCRGHEEGEPVRGEREQSGPGKAGPHA